MQEQELFQQYELKGWQFSPRLYKIIGASVLVNLLVFTLMAKANFLTGKTCDSPVASGVCSVLDALYLGSVIASTNSIYTDNDYEKIELEDADITFVDFTGVAPPLEYPEGYFALANPEQQPLVTDLYNPATPGMDIPGIPNNPTITNTTPDLTAVNPTYPTPNKKASTKGFPTSPFGTIENGTTSKSSVTSKPNKPSSKQNDANNTEKPKQDQSESVKEIEITRKPFEDLGDEVNEQRAKKEVDLNKNFSVVMDGIILADGKLDSKKSKFIKSDGDPQMINVAKSALEAVGSSGFLSYLKNQGIDRVNITLIQNDTEIYALVVSDQKTAEKAASTASGLNLAISGAIMLDENNIKKLDDNSRILVKNSKVTSDKSNFILKFTLPKQDAQAIINKTLDDRAEKKNKQLNSSGEVNNNTNAKTGK